ncbi:PhoPQ-activated protein PqaA family protein [Pedobacter steynii]
MVRKLGAATTLILCLITLLVQAQTTTSSTVITPTTALSHYLNNADNTFKWELKDSYDLDDVTVFTILLTSQKWREYTWTHQLSIMVPKRK